ncbi:MAG: ATP-binding protein [bacterium]|nr:ATP-binding protein [bacterium]
MAPSILSVMQAIIGVDDPDATRQIMGIASPEDDPGTLITDGDYTSIVNRRLGKLMDEIATLLQNSGCFSKDSISRIKTGFSEGFANACLHGNLERSSVLREGDGTGLVESLRNRTPYMIQRRIEVEMALIYEGEAPTDTDLSDTTVFVTKKEKSDEPEGDSVTKVIDKFRINIARQIQKVDNILGVRITITDEGPGFTPDDVPDSTAEGFIERPSGRGLLMMRAMCDEVVFNEMGNSVSMTQNVDQDFRALEFTPPITTEMATTAAGVHDWVESILRQIETDAQLRTLVCDLRTVDFVTSEFFNALAHLKRHKFVHRIELHNLQPVPKQAVDSLNLDGHILMVIQ